MDLGAVGQGGIDMPAVFLAAPQLLADVGEWATRDDGDAVIAFHAGDRLMRIAQRGDPGGREYVVMRLGFLQADYVGIEFFDEAPEVGQPQPHAIDVPGDDFHGSK